VPALLFVDLVGFVTGGATAPRDTTSALWVGAMLNWSSRY
jgi:hypothetical protein